MKKTVLVLFIIFITKIATAQIDLKDPTAVTFSAGFFLPYSSDVFKSGATIGIDVQHKVEPVFLFLSLAYNSSERKKMESSQNFENKSGTSITEILFGARLYPVSNKLKYFLDIGMGCYFERKGSYSLLENGNIVTYPSENNTTFGGNFGAGIEYPINRDFDFVAKGKYHLYFGVGNDPFINAYFGITAGVKYNIKL